MGLTGTICGLGKANLTITKLVLLGLAATQLVACGRNIVADSLLAGLISNKSSKEEKACEVGVNGANCGVQVSGSTVWSNEFSTSSTPQQNSGTANEKKFTYVTRYQFKAVEGGESLWRRILTVTIPAGETRSMSQAGRVEQVTGDRLYLVMTATSCDDEVANLVASPKNVDLFYERVGTSLRLSESKIEKAKISSIGDIFAVAIGSAIGEAVSVLFREVFSFGNARVHLESGDIRLSLSKPFENESLGTLGCWPCPRVS